MRKVVSGRWSVFGRWSCLLLSAFCLLSCSVPNLEEPECGQARDNVREFYSLHFGNKMTFTADGLEKRKDYLTPRLYESLKGGSPDVDPFTRTSDLPRAFRVGECRVAQPETRLIFNVLLFWKTDTRSEQRSIDVDAMRVDDKWLIDAVSDNKQF